MTYKICYIGFFIKVSLEPFQRLIGVDRVHGLNLFKVPEKGNPLTSDS